MLKYLMIIFLFVSFSVKADYTINGTLNPSNNYTWVILYKVENGKQVYVEKANVTNGKFTFDLGKDASVGIYRAYYQMEKKLYVEFIFNNENLDFTFDPNRPIETIKFSNSKENQLFQDYLHQTEEYQKQIDSLQITFFEVTDEDQYEKIKMAYKKKVKELKNIQKEFEKKSEGKLAYNFIKASAKNNTSHPFKQPQDYLNHVKAHFFDAIDFNNKVLSNSTFINDRLLDYVFYLTQVDDLQARNKLQKEVIDEIIVRLEGNSEVVSRFEDSLLFNYMKSENKEMADYVIDNYYHKLPKEYQDEALLFRLKSTMKTAIGVQAPDFSWQKNGTSKSLYSQIGYDYYMVVFFSSTCPHCQVEIPEFHEFIKGFNNIKVIAVGLEVEKSGWETMTKDYKEFINIIDLKKWDSQKVKDYGVTAIPSYFLLDGNKKIVAKPNDVAELKEMFKPRD